MSVTYLKYKISIVHVDHGASIYLTCEVLMYFFLKEANFSSHYDVKGHLII
jgi:hypothetical protein